MPGFNCPCGSELVGNGIGASGCQCKDGFDTIKAVDGFITCEDINECTEFFPCHSNATCYNTVASFKCSCKKGFSGNGLQCIDIDECKSNPCSAAAECKNTIGLYLCTCHDGWTGDGIGLNGCTGMID